jgi:hypothetical protein
MFHPVRLRTDTNGMENMPHVESKEETLSEDSQEVANCMSTQLQEDRPSLNERMHSVLANAWVLLLPYLSILGEIAAHHKHPLLKSAIIIGTNSSLAITYLLLSYLHPREMQKINFW